MGLDWKYKHVSEVYTEMAATMPSLRNISWERIDREDSVIYPSRAPDVPGDKIAFTEGFPTADGRAKIVPADLLPPDEVPDAEFPLVLTTGRLLEHWHTGSMTRRAGVLDAIEPVGIAAMNPRDMHAARAASRRPDHGRDAAWHSRGDPAGRSRGRRRHGVHAVLLRREPGQPIDESEARSVRQDSGVQVLRCARRASARSRSARRR